MSDDLRRRSMRIFSHVKRNQAGNDEHGSNDEMADASMSHESDNKGEREDAAQDGHNHPQEIPSDEIGKTIHRNANESQPASAVQSREALRVKTWSVTPSHQLTEDTGEAAVHGSFPLPRVIAIANQKGGVGKTTTSVNLGASIAETGGRVLIVDLDPQGNATTGLGIQHRDLEGSVYDVIINDKSLDDCTEPTSVRNLFVIPATIDLAGAEIELVPAFSREMKLKRAISEVKDQYDYIIIDCPPSLGLLTVNALAAADDVIVPIQCEYYALEGLSQLINNVNLVQTNLNANLTIRGIILTMYDARTKLAEQVESEVREHFGAQVYTTVIPRTVRLSEAPSFGQAITTFDPTSRGAIAYRELAKEVRNGETRWIG